MLKPIRNFFAVLIDHGRIPMAAQIARQFEKELNSELGFVEADITSSRQLSPDEKSGLESRVEKPDWQEGSCPLCHRPGITGRSGGSRGQHDL